MSLEEMFTKSVESCDNCHCIRNPNGSWDFVVVSGKKYCPWCLEDSIWFDNASKEQR